MTEGVERTKRSKPDVAIKCGGDFRNPGLIEIYKLTL